MAQALPFSSRQAAARPAVRGRHGPNPGPAAAAEQHWLQAMARLRTGDLAQAERLLVSATGQAPAVALYWVNLANVQRKARREVQALASARRGFDLDRNSLVGCHLLTELLRLANRPDDALAVLRQLDAGSPRDANHWWLEGDLLFALNRPEEAAQALLQALTLQPSHMDAYMKLGFSLAWLKQYGAAAECFRTVAMMDSHQVGAAVYAAHYAAWACDWPQGRDDLLRMQAAMALFADQQVAPPTSPFCLVAITDDAALQRQVARREADRLARELARRIDWQPGQGGAPGREAARARLAAGRIRVGFVSCDFRGHATSILMARLVELLDRRRFEVLLYSHGAHDESDLHGRLLAAADAFVDCRTMSTAEQAARIRDDGVALLVDLGGFTLNSRLQLFALRPAPVQASWLAFPGTTGAGYIDYVIGDPVVTPLAHGADFEEQIAQLPVSYQANDALRPHPPTLLGRADVGLPEQGIVFCCFNQSYKFTEACFDSWCRILARVPGSVLWLLVPQAEVQLRLREQVRARGVAEERLVFADFVSQNEHLARLPLADIALDTFPCGAHTTCSDALWMGVPLITRYGQSFASRVAASLLCAVGLEGLAVQDAADYEQLAVSLADDREALTDIRDHLWDNRLDLPLFDSERFALDMAALMERMVGRWAQGLAPQALAAELGAPAD